MAKFIEWYTAHNTIVIQGLAVVIALIICGLLFRIFFMAPATDGASIAHSQLDSLEDKVNRLLEKGVAGPSDSGANSEIENMRAEIYNLRQALKEKEAGAPVTTINTEMSTSDVGFSAGTSLNSLSQEESKKFQKQIEDLKSRLEEYELIAEDIADLHKLREENQLLKQKIGVVGIPAPEPIPQTAIAKLEVPTSKNFSESVNEPITVESNQIISEEPASEAESVLSVPAEELAASSDVAAAAEQPVSKPELESLPTDAVADASVTDIDKNLIDDFEKKNSSAKGS